MAFLRMLPAAGLASLYAAFLLVLLILFLNPHLALHPSTLLGLLPLLLALSIPGAVGWPAGYRFLRVFARRRLRVRWISFKFLVGFTGANLIPVAILYAANGSQLEAMLPESLSVRLKVATAAIALVSIAFSVAAFLKRWRRVPAFRWACGSVAILLPIGLVGLRGGDAVEPPPPYTPELVKVGSEAPRLLFLGIEGATLDMILPLVAQGKLPWTERLLQRGAHGRLTSFKPCVSVVTWESLLTGKLPSKHQVMDAIRYSIPLGGGEILLTPRGLLFHRLAGWAGLRPAPQGEADSKALTWVEILNQLGYPSRLFGPGAVPETLVPPTDLHLDRFLDPESPTPPDTRELRDTLIESLNEDNSAATAALETWRDPRTRGVALQLRGLDRVSHLFLRYSNPVAFGDVPSAEIRKFGGVLEAYYRFVDEWIGRFLSVPIGGGTAAEGWLVVLVSPHGIEPVPLRGRIFNTLLGQRFESGTHVRGPDGVLVVAGPGVVHGRPLGKSLIVDLTPTLLYYLRLPIGMDLDGHPLTRLFGADFMDRRPVLLIPSYEGSRLSRSPAGRSSGP